MTDGFLLAQFVPCVVCGEGVMATYDDPAPKHPECERVEVWTATDLMPDTCTVCGNGWAMLNDQGMCSDPIACVAYVREHGMPEPYCE